MEMQTYERPREKMQQSGVVSLSNVELLQVIIGSGTAGIPVTKIARKVYKLLKAKPSTFLIDELIAIPGLGKVKAGQLIASLELCGRLLSGAFSNADKVTEETKALYNDIRSSKDRLLVCVYFDGNGRVVDDYSQTISSQSSTSDIVRKLFSKALSRSAVKVSVYVGYEEQVLEPSLFELSLARDVYRTANLLSISIKNITLVNKEAEYKMQKGSYGK
jgi:DNA repair protein RadC